MKKVSITLYIVALIITLAIFTFAFAISNYLNNKRTQELKSTVDKISIDILSLETQFDIAKESSCQQFDKNAVRNELNSLSSKLTFMESQVGTNNPDVFRLKRYYSLLEIRDYLLTKKMSEQCKFHTVFILYFYTQNPSCTECRTQEYILQAVRDTYPEAEIYTFDYDVDLPAVKTLITLHNIPETPPIIDINGKVYAPFQSFADIQAIIDPYISTSTSKTAATSTKASKKQ